jgi:hypothetical protein
MEAMSSSAHCDGLMIGDLTLADIKLMVIPLCLLHLRFVVCSKEQGSVARFINHSCKPNLYVQPICGGHTDPDMVAVGLFAWHDIPPFIELA